MEKKYIAFMFGIIFLIGLASAYMPKTIAETEFNKLIQENKNCIYQEEYWTLDASKTIKGGMFENKIDLLCILVTAKADKIKLELLEQRVLTLEQKVADLENIIYNTKGTTIITDTKGEIKNWWEFWK